MDFRLSFSTLKKIFEIKILSVDITLYNSQQVSEVVNVNGLSNANRRLGQKQTRTQSLLIGFGGERRLDTRMN